MNPTVTAAALASAEARTAAIMRRAEQLTGKPEEHDARILVEHAQRITNNLRAIHETTDRRNNP